MFSPLPVCPAPALCGYPSCECEPKEQTMTKPTYTEIDEPTHVLQDIDTRLSSVEARITNTVNKFGCSYVDCDCKAPCWQKAPELPVINITNNITINGDVLIGSEIETSEGVE